METRDIYEGWHLAIFYIYVRVVRFKEGRRSAIDNLNKSEIKVTRYRQSWKKDAMCLSFAYSFLPVTNFLNTKWKEDFSTQNFEQRFSRFHYKTPYNFPLWGTQQTAPGNFTQIQNLTFITLLCSITRTQSIQTKGFGPDGQETSARFPKRAKIFPFFKTVQTAWLRGPKQPPIQWVQPAHSLAVKRPGHKTNHSLCYNCPVLDWGSADC